MPRRRTALRIEDVPSMCASPIVHVRELEAFGIGRRTVANRCLPGGPWRRILPGVVKLHSGPTSRDDRRHAALIHCGPGTLITGADALRLHGATRGPEPSGPVHVLVPHDRRRVGAGHVLVERTERLPKAAPGRWPLAPVHRAALDLTRRSADRNLVRTILAEVVQRRMTTVEELSRELEAGTSRGTALSRSVLAEVADGIRSVAEANARSLIAESGLGPFLWNPTLVDEEGRTIAEPDAWLDEVCLAWEIDSLEFHLSPEDYATTLRRSAALTARGIVVVHTTPTMLRTERGRVLADLKAAAEQAALRPRPAIRAIPAPR